MRREHHIVAGVVRERIAERLERGGSPLEIALAELIRSVEWYGVSYNDAERRRNELDARLREIRQEAADRR